MSISFKIILILLFSHFVFSALAKGPKELALGINNKVKLQRNSFAKKSKSRLSPKQQIQMKKEDNEILFKDESKDLSQYTEPSK